MGALIRCSFDAPGGSDAIEIIFWKQLGLYDFIEVLVLLLSPFHFLEKYRCCLGIQLLQRWYVYSTWYLHWWSLLLDCQVAFWLTRQFQWNSFSI